VRKKEGRNCEEEREGRRLRKPERMRKMEEE
jgi:hypothetical protein